MELLVSKTLARALALKGQGPDLMRAGTPVAMLLAGPALGVPAEDSALMSVLTTPG